MQLDCDYLVVGAGLAGLAFADALVAGSDASVIIADRRHGPGGHWLEAYPFVRLHQPSRLYGVASTPFGEDRIVEHGLDAGFYERAAGSEVCGYFDRVMQQRLLASGQVRFLPRTEYLGEGRLRSLVTGDLHTAEVRRSVVDGTFTESRLPNSEPPPFELASDVRCVPPNALVHLEPSAERVVVIGAGKTSMDTCQWLLEQGYDAGRITWIRPRDLWLLNRTHFQGGRFIEAVAEGAAAQMEAAAAAQNADEFFERCADREVMLRLDEDVRPAMVRGSTSDVRELALLRQIEHVVRLGHVRRIERDRVLLEQGELSTRKGTVFIHCAARGIAVRPPIAIFQPGRITLQAVRIASPAFSSALIGFLEASGRDAVENNRLAHPNAFMSHPLGWLRATLQSRLTEAPWKRESDLKAWLEGTQLNVGRGMGQLAQDPQGLAVLKRLGASTPPALENLARLLAAGPAEERALFWRSPAVSHPGGLATP